MKNLLNTLIILMVSIYTISCSGNQQNASLKDAKLNPAENQTIYVYYFHTNIRCETCVAVDEHTEAYLKTLFPEKVKNKQIIFESINIEEKGHEDLIKKYKVWGQTLLFIKGDTVIDRTNDAFLNVTTNPDKWKSMVKQQVEELLNKN